MIRRLWFCMHHDHASGETSECYDHDDVIKWKHFPRKWPFVRGIHRWPVNSPHKGQWRGALIFSLICAWINDCVNQSGDLRRHRAHYDVIVMDDAITCRGASHNRPFARGKCWLSGIWTIFHLTFNWYTKIFMTENAFKNIVLEMALCPGPNVCCDNQCHVGLYYAWPKDMVFS